MSMNTAMVDICLIVRSHTQYSCVHPSKNNEQSLFESPLICKINHRAQCISDFLQGLVTSNTPFQLAKNLLFLAVTSSGDNRMVANDS